MTPSTLTRRKWFAALGAGSVGGVLGCRARRDYSPGAFNGASAEFRPALAVSLRGLAAAFQRSRQAADVANLGGLSRLVGVSAEPDGDILLMGHPGARSLHIDDVAITLRSAYHAGPDYQEPIGCTIDPREGADDPWVIQVARTFGIEPSAMAARQVAIDYEMKRASLGLIVLKAGMPTVWSGGDGVSECAANAPRTMGATQTVHRFWFCPKVPEAPRFVRDGDAIWIQKPVGVQVLTEQEFLDSNAHRVGGKPAEGPAIKFAVAMSGLCGSSDLPQYVALRADFRLIEAAKLAPLLGLRPDSLGYYLNQHEVRKVNVPKYVGGLWREESTELTCENRVDEIPMAGGISYQSHADVRTRRRRVIGGVEARVSIADRDVRPGDKELSDMMTRVRQARPSADAATWTVPA